MSQQQPPGPPEGWGPPPPGGPEQPSGQPQQPPGAPYGQPGQQQPGWGPPAATQQPPKKGSRGRGFALGCLGVLGVLVLVGIIVALAGGGDDGGTGTATDQPSATTTGTKTTEAAPKAAGIGTPVRDGKFEFTVSKVDCGKSRIGTKDFGTTAQGQFCLVSVKVENIGQEAQTLDGSSQYLYGDGGQKYDADTEAAIYLDDAQTFLEQINPGNTVNGVVVFDIPKDAKPAKIELHDSPFSGGVTVDL